MDRHRVIAVLVDTSTSWGRNIIRGIRLYTQEAGTDWIFYLQPWGTYDQVRLPKKWSGDGVIARVTHEALVEDIAKSRCPAVNVSTTPIQQAGHLLQCTVNERAVGKLAAGHFLERGFREFAYFSYSTPRARYHDLLAEGFADTLRTAGFQASNCPQAADGKKSYDWDFEQRRMARWLLDRPKPLAAFAWNSVRARQVVDACRMADIKVPEEVAVLAGDYDDVMCDTATPPLSSVDLPARQIGYHAARILHEMLEGGSPATPFLLDPVGITVRRSTDSVAVDDPELALALSFLRKHAVEAINIKTVLKEVPIGRRSLEQQCLKLLGRSPAAEIRRIRLQRAAQLLAETKLSIEQVARNSGFASADILLRNFRRAYGVTPTEFRQKQKQGG